MKKRTASYFQIKTDILIAWSEQNGYGSREEILRALMRDSRSMTELDPGAVKLYSDNSGVAKKSQTLAMELGIKKLHLVKEKTK